MCLLTFSNIKIHFHFLTNRICVPTFGKLKRKNIPAARTRVGQVRKRFFRNYRRFALLFNFLYFFFFVLLREYIFFNSGSFFPLILIGCVNRTLVTLKCDHSNTKKNVFIFFKHLINKLLFKRENL